MVTVDAVAGVAIDPAECANELGTIKTLSAGLLRIAQMISRPEQAWQANRKGKLNFHSFGQDIDGTKGDLEIIACMFHWFGVSVCNVARLAGFVRGLAKKEFTRA